MADAGTPDVAVAGVYAPGVLSPATGGRSFPTPGTAAGPALPGPTPLLGVILLIAGLLLLERRRLRLLRRRK